MEIPEVRFARSGDLHIAYSRYGDGLDAVLVPPLVSNLELSWEACSYREPREYIARYLRILEFDKRGMGSSDRFEHAPSLNERMCDIQAVMDAEGVERANLIGLSEGGLMSILFAATHPERVERLVLVNCAPGATATAATAHLAKRPPGDVVRDLFTMAATWGRDPQVMIDLMNPSQSEDSEFKTWLARFQRQTASRLDVKRQVENLLTLDAAEHLAQVQAPTLVVNVRGDRVVAPASGRWLAERIPSARYIEFPGTDHFFWAMPNWRELLDDSLEFVLGYRPQTMTRRRLAVVVFTDIVGSTRRCQELGDSAWRALLERHDQVARRLAERHAGQILKSMGDGLLMLFDMPSSAVAFAAALQPALQALGIEIRTGMHAGEVEVREDGDVIGVAVNFAARVEAIASAGSVFVSSTVRDLLLGSSVRFTDRGRHTLEGIEGQWRLYELA